MHVVDDLSTGNIGNITPLLSHPNFNFSQQDVLTWSGLYETVAKSQRIYHMAAVVGVRHVLEDPVKVMSTNMSGTERLLRAAHHGGHNPETLIASSSEVYGFNSAPTFSETSDVVLRAGGRLRWAYAVTKLADEYLGYSYFRQYGMNVVIARLFNTVGPRQTGRYGMVVPNFVRQAVAGEAITVFGDGTQTRSFCDVRDTVQALDALLSCEAARGEIVNVGNDREIAIGELAALVRERAGSDSPITLTPYEEAYGVAFEDVTHRRPDLEKLYRLTSFRPQRSLEETVDELIDTVREKYSGAAGGM